MNYAATTVHPYLVQPNDSFTFWCRYALENNYDVTVVEVSENKKEWFNLDTTRFTGTQNSWVRKAYSLANWVGKSVYFRFRTMYDSDVQSGGFYVDDISPICYFNNVDIISNSITDTTYTFFNHPLGEYYYYVRGYNTTWLWGDYSCLEKVFVSNFGVSDKTGCDKTNEFSLTIHPNLFKNQCVIKFQIPNNSAFREPRSAISLKVYDVSGRVVKDFSRLTINGERSTIFWDGKDNSDKKLPAGIYFVHLETGDYKKIEKAILLK